MTGWITTIMTGINGTFSSFHRRNTSSIWKLGNILFQSKCRRSAAQRQRKNESCSSTGRWEQGQYGYSPGVVPGSNAAALPRPASGAKPRNKSKSSITTMVYRQLLQGGFIALVSKRQCMPSCGSNKKGSTCALPLANPIWRSCRSPALHYPPYR